MNFFDAILLVVQPFTLLVIVASGIFGLFVGAMPGLTATMAAALLVHAPSAAHPARSPSWPPPDVAPPP